MDFNQKMWHGMTAAEAREHGMEPGKGIPDCARLHLEFRMPEVHIDTLAEITHITVGKEDPTNFQAVLSRAIEADELRYTHILDGTLCSIWSLAYWLWY
jgi:hypothetical protein